MKKKSKDKNIKEVIEVTEEVRVGDYMLESGDKVEVLNESSGPMMDYADDMVMDIFGGDYEKAFTEVIMSMSDGEIKETVDFIYRMRT